MEYKEDEILTIVYNEKKTLETFRANLEWYLSDKEYEHSCEQKQLFNALCRLSEKEEMVDCFAQELKAKIISSEVNGSVNCLSYTKNNTISSIIWDKIIRQLKRLLSQLTKQSEKETHFVKTMQQQIGANTYVYFEIIDIMEDEPMKVSFYKILLEDYRRITTKTITIEDLKLNKGIKPLSLMDFVEALKDYIKSNTKNHLKEKLEEARKRLNYEQYLNSQNSCCEIHCQN